VFFIDMVGHIDEPAISEALEEVSTHCRELKILGSYPHGELEE
jgi:chorismate mutase/prephenate dehydratase